MIYRQLTEELLKWSERDNRKPLVLRGARQVGKTTLVNELGKKYDVYIKLNLEQSSDAEIFTKSDNVKEIYQYICLKKKIKVDERKRTLLFIDEIQNEPKAVGLLRYFYEEMPWLHIIAAGSRLQTLIKQRISFPVGRVDYLSLRPCSFLEYLDAIGEDQLVQIRHLLTHGWAEAGQSITFARFGGSNYTSKEVHEALEVMQKAFLLNLDYPVTSVKAPAVPAIARQPKLVWVDTGIMNFSVDIQAEYLQGNSLLDVWKGHAAEQIIAQELRIVLDRNFRNEQYYWVRDKKGSSAEVDFVWQHHSQILPIEVKSGTNAHLRSLHSFMSQPDAPSIAIRIWPGEYSIDEVVSPTGHPFRLINLPFYYVGILDKILEIV